MDWGLGHYEHIAADLAPAARVVVDRAAPAPGEAVLDVGCGTGNAALLAATRRARVIGVDPAERLLEVARARAAEAGLPASFRAGTAAELQLADASAEVIVSVFGVIFAPDPGAAAAELARVTAPEGRVVLSAWVPRGALFDATRALRETLTPGRRARARPGFAWHDRDELARLLAPHGFSVEMHAEALGFTASSPEAFLAGELRDHPMWIGARKALEARGELRRVRAEVLRVLEAANEDLEAFRVTSRYVVAVARRG